ncbi:MAG: dimethyl sulfoxide reductase anchor subunit [Rhodospirillales bacterium]|nr:dimethyl sulfoxide reductase anchor subunit [Rhodospirillales bacterium]
MRPALSVIFFTTASGAGYGLLGLLGLLAPAGLTPATPWFGLASNGLGLALVTAGLLASVFHLGHPERAWRAMTQWRSSWLSREGVAAVVAYPIFLAFAASWIIFGRPNAILGFIAALIATTTVFCTGKIYSTLRPIRQWHHPLTVPGYLLLSIFTGLSLLAALTLSPRIGVAAAVMAIAALGLKYRYWHSIDRSLSATTLATATGLGQLGQVRMLDPPHATPNYLMHEMGYRIARANSARLRRAVLGAGFAVPALLLLLGIAGGPLGVLAPVAALLSLIGTLGERWLFFAEATHTQALYYGLNP